MRSEFEWDSAMANAAKRGDEACLKSLVEHFSEVWPDRDFLGARGISAMREACIHGRKLCLEILLHAMGPSVQLEFALRLAACNGLEIFSSGMPSACGAMARAWRCHDVGVSWLWCILAAG